MTGTTLAGRAGAGGPSRGSRLAPGRRFPFLPTVVIGFLSVLIVGYASLAVGTGGLTPRAAVESLVDYDATSTEQVLVRTGRVPRTLIGVLVGAALAVAGAVMQALTRNPLADPFIFGINHGAALAAVTALTMFGVSLQAAIPAALAGAAATAVAVYLLGSVGRGGLTPWKLTVAGASIAVMLYGAVQGLLVVNEQSLEQSVRWLGGSLTGRELSAVDAVAPYLVAGFVTAFALGPALTVFEFGEHAARGLGQRTGLVKGAGGAAVVLLAGASVAVAGPVGFVGLAIPHLSRALVGTSYRRILPVAALLGAVLVLLADIAARQLIAPQELPVGVLTALVGVPFFLAITGRLGGRR